MYDELGRLQQKKLNDIYPTNYEYVSKGYRTSFLLEKLKLGENEYTYQYDVLDNITDIFCNNIKTNHYEYDDHNELVKDDDYKRNVTTIYTYDVTGNLRKKQEYKLETEELIKQDIYTYGNTNWEDQLTGFNNMDITYDEIGNPLTIGDKTLSWINGRQLEQIKENDTIMTYEYNKDSVRTKKVVNGIETTYQLENNHILFERTGRNMIYYIRDENQNLVGFRYNDTTYYYLKNAQEDIIGILDSDYNVVANYQYDAWGRIISIIDSNGVEITDTEHIAYKSPFRYRSYYYDFETGYYYLNSRYYDPNWGRFLNADNAIIQNNNLVGNNLFSYCMNNPTNRNDNSGNISVKSMIKIFNKIGSSMIRGLKSVGKTVKGTGKKIGKMVSNAISTLSKGSANIQKKLANKVSNDFNQLKKAMVFEVGNGVGHGIEVESIGVSQKSEMTSTVKDSNMTCSLSKSNSVGFGVMGITNSSEQRISCDGKIAYSDFETKNYLNILFFEFSDDSIFFGLNFDAFFYSGGHIKIGLMID